MKRLHERSRNRMTAVALITALTALLAGTAAAANTWDGGGANANWNTPENWDDDTVPADTADVTFATGFASGTAISLNGNRTANSLTLNTNATFSLNNNTLTLTSGNITVTVGGNRDLNCAVDIGATDAMWDIAGTVQLNGNVGLDIQGDLISSGSLTKTGSGTLLLNRTGGMPNLTGDVIVNQGQLSCRYQGSQLRYANSLTLSNASLYADAHGNNLPATGTITLHNATLQEKGSLPATQPNAISLTGANTVLFDNGKILSGPITGTGSLTLNAGWVWLANDGSSYTGKTRANPFLRIDFTSIANAGANSALGAPTGTGADLEFDDSTFRYVGTDPAGHVSDRNFKTTQTRDGVINASGAGTLVLNGNITVHGASGWTAYGLTLTGTGSAEAHGRISISSSGLFKDGSGTWILTASDNSITGTSQINQGTLRVNNASGSGLGTSPVVVNAGGTLGGTGILTGAVTVKGGATLAAGAAAGCVGVLTLGNLTLEESAVIRIEYTDAANDRIDVSGALSLPTVATVTTTNIEGPCYGDAILISAAAPIAADVSGWTVTGPLDKGEVVIQGNQLIIKGPTKGTLILLR